VQVPKNQRRAFEGVLDELKFPYWEETDNRAYQLYLANQPA
jgi:threonine dehydratase